MKDKKSFILYCDQKGVWDKLDDTQAGKLIKHIISYVNDENPTAPDFITELAFEPIKQSLKRDLKKWENQYVQRVEAGRKSAEIRKRNSTTVDERSNSSTVSVSVSDNVSVSVNGSVSERVKDRAWFDSHFDELFLESLKMNHKGKDIPTAINQAWTYLAADELRLRNSDGANCKQLVAKWLSNMKIESTKPERKKLL